MFKLKYRKWVTAHFFLVLVLTSASSLFAQNQITGKVISNLDKMPIPGVSIFIKGTTIGTISDFDGQYSILTKPEDILIFSYIGMVSQEIKVGSQNTINITLLEDTKQLDEIVVVGYGTQKKSHLTGAISKVTNEKLDQIPVSRLDDALIGQVSGVNIQQTNPEAGEAPTIQVRGVGSIGAGSGPAVVVDGVLVDADYMASLDMNDVASVEVLKDASSAAIFGSRGGNGVIMITTKSGETGEVKYNFNAYYGRKWALRRDDFRPTVEQNKIDAQNYIDNIETLWPADLPMDQRDYVLNKANTTIRRMEHMQRILGDQPEKDWQDIIFEEGNIQSYSLSANGGSENTTYNISGAYLQDDGVLLSDAYKKINLRLKLKTKLSKRVELGLNINPVREEKQVFPTSVHESLRQSSWLPITHDEHTIQFVDKTNFPDVAVGDYAQEAHFNNYPNPDDPTEVLPNVSVTNNSNPYANIVERDHKEITHRIYSNMYLKLKLAKGLKFRTSFVATYKDRTRNYYDGTKASRNGAADARLRTRTYQDFDWINDNYFTYEKSIGKHEINATLGMSFERRQDIYTETIGTGYSNDAVKTMNAASVIAFGDEYVGVQTLHSIFGRVNYAFNDKYLFSVSVRSDGSSKFGSNYQYGIFPAASFGWRVTEESFMENIDWISVLKPRVSYGITGNNSGIGLYEALGRMDPASAVINGGISSGYIPSNIAQPDLRWEQQVEINPGIDYGFFGNRIYGSIEWYRRTSNDLLLTQQIPSITGFDERTVNLGKVQNEGFEFEFNAKPIMTNNFKWTLSANASTNTNKLVDFGGVDSLISIVDSKRPANWIAATGNPISSFYGYKIDRTKGDNGSVPFEYLNEGFWPIGGESQLGYVQDLNGDGKIDENDRTIIGSPYPSFIWSVTNTFQIKNFDFSFMFQGSMGGQVLNIDPQYYEYQTMQGQRPNTAYFEDMNQVRERILTDDMVQDVSFISLRNINIGYTLPTNWVSKIGFNKARLYASGSNLIYIMSDDYTSFNPEGIRDEGPINYGYQRGASPIPRSFIVGVNAEF